MGGLRDALEVSLEAAFDLGTLDEDRHAATVEAARAVADLIDASPEPTASMMGAYLNYCKALAIVPQAQQQQVTVVGTGRVASMRAKSRANLKAV